MEKSFLSEVRKEMAKANFRTKQKFFIEHNGQRVVFRKYRNGRCIGESGHGRLRLDKYGLFWIIKENQAMDGHRFTVAQGVSMSAFRDIVLVNKNTFRREEDFLDKPNSGTVFCFA